MSEHSRVGWAVLGIVTIALGGGLAITLPVAGWPLLLAVLPVAAALAGVALLRWSWVRPPRRAVDWADVGARWEQLPDPVQEPSRGPSFPFPAEPVPADPLARELRLVTAELAWIEGADLPRHRRSPHRTAFTVLATLCWIGGLGLLTGGAFVLSGSVLLQAAGAALGAGLVVAAIPLFVHALRDVRRAGALRHREAALLSRLRR